MRPIFTAIFFSVCVVANAEEDVESLAKIRRDLDALVSKVEEAKESGNQAEIEAAIQELSEFSKEYPRRLENLRVQEWREFQGVMKSAFKRTPKPREDTGFLENGRLNLEAKLTLS